MKNIELNNLNNAIRELLLIPIEGGLKFKIAKLYHEVDREMIPLIESISGLSQDSKEFKDIMEMENPTNISVELYPTELEPLNISTYTLLLLEPVIKEAVIKDV